MTEDELEHNVRDACKKLNVIRVHQFNSIGTQAGWPDDALVGPRGAIFRELKSQKGRVRPGQAKMLAAMDVAGLNVAIWRPMDWLDGTILTEIEAIA